MLEPLRETRIRCTEPK